VFRFPCIFALTATLLVAPPAEARGVSHGSHESLVFAAESTQVGPSGPISLCHHTRTRTVFEMGYWLSYQGLVLSETHCEGTQYFALRPGVNPDAITAGADPDGWTLALALHYARGFFWPIIAPFFLFFATMDHRRRNRRTEIRRSTLALEEGPVFRFIDAMCHAAAVDGDVDPEEIRYITSVACQLTNRDYGTEHIEYVIAHCSHLRTIHEFRQFAKGLNRDQKLLIMRAVLAVIDADGRVSRAEKRFLRHMQKALRIRRRQMKALRMTAPTPPTDAALA